MAQNRFTEHVNTIVGLTPSQHKVLKTIAQFTNHETGEAFPSLGTIAAGADVARSTVQNAIDALCEAGHLEFVRQRKTPRGHVNVYRVTIPTHHTDFHHTDFHHTDTDHHTEVVHHTDGSGLVESVDSRTSPPYRQNPVGTERTKFSSLPISVNRNEQNLNSTDSFVDLEFEPPADKYCLVRNGHRFDKQSLNCLNPGCAMTFGVWLNKYPHCESKLKAQCALPGSCSPEKKAARA